MRLRVKAPLSADGINAAMTANEKGHLVASSYIQVHAAAAGPVTVRHDLNDIPDDFQYSRMDNLGIGLYATESQRAGWTDASCELMASAAGDFWVCFVKRIV